VSLLQRLRGEKNVVNYFHGGQLVVDAVLFTCTKSYGSDVLGTGPLQHVLKGGICSKPTHMCTAECVATQHAHQPFQSWILGAVEWHINK
jgi:hypothetical protein